jgi:hypothetical protein
MTRAALLFSVLTACATEESTGVLVVFTGEPQVIATTETAEVTAFRGASTADALAGIQTRQRLEGGGSTPSPTSLTWPLLVGISAGKESRVWAVEARLLDAAGAAILSRSVTGRFVEGSVVRFDVTLEDACRDQRCGLSQTCIGGQCGSTPEAMGEIWDGVPPEPQQVVAPARDGSVDADAAPSPDAGDAGDAGAGDVGQAG